MKEKRIEKEIKKAQKKGIYNPKLKLGIVGLILVIGTVIGVSYAYYTDKSTTVLTISGTVSKKINITVQAANGNVTGSSSQTVDYGTAARFTVTPYTNYEYSNVSCNSNGQGNVDKSYNNNTLTITPWTINNVSCTVTFKEKVRTLKEIADEIIKTAKPTTLTSTDFAKGCPLSDNDTCSGVYKMDDYSNSSNLTSTNGTSYYFRGKVDNNYVKFGKGTTSDNSSQHDLLWRIVRINGDGSIRLVLDSVVRENSFSITNATRNDVGYTYDNKTPCTNSSPCTSTYSNSSFTNDHNGTNSTIKSFLEDWYKDNLSSYDSKIALGIYCNDTSYGSGSETSELYYGAYERLQASSSSINPKLTCPDPTANSNETQFVTNVGSTKYHKYGGVYKLKIGLLSADEMAMAGFNSGSGVTESNYLYYYNSSSTWVWSMSPSSSFTTDVYLISSARTSLTDFVTYFPLWVRPVINLKANTIINKEGTGTSTNPYVVQ